MIRTKEFLLFLLLISFLLLAIMLTVWLQQEKVSNVSETPLVFAADAETEGVSLVATVAESNAEVSYVKQQMAMREKVLAYRQREVDISENFLVGDPARLAESIASNSSDAHNATGGMYQCSGYQAYQAEWPATVAMAEREGARLFYERSASADIDRPDQFSPVDVLVQLPVHVRPHISPSCLTTDVVGITKNGALIRTHEVATYEIFSGSTIVGYALDGFPIFGKDDSVQVDRCGGATVGGQYGYVLQSDRNTIVECFSGTPVALP